MQTLWAAAPFVDRLAAHGDAVALRAGSTVLSYAELDDLVSDRAARLGATRRLVLLRATNSLESVVDYLAALRGRHPVLIASATQDLSGYDPDVVLDQGRIHEVRPGTMHDLHPDLAVLLSTSGSTGSPKLVRLSLDNLTSNASAIASYLGLRPTDCAPTTLPLQYCYGLSVLNSHLSVGASVLLTDSSVSSEHFWSEFAQAHCTLLAGVPYTFELLDRVGFADRHLPSLRIVTQAGGRLDPERVTAYAELGRRRGFDLFVMYGQTEATARMAYLPPDRALDAPGAVGVPIPGGSFRIADDGELLYTGDNVMLGYATSPADLGRGRDVGELRTGDLARLRPDGLYEITGRVSRVAKVFGLRIDLDQVERSVAADGLTVTCVDGGDRLIVAIDTSARRVPEDVGSIVAARAGIGPVGLQVVELAGLPRLANGKVDHGSIRTVADALRCSAPPAHAGPTVSPADLCAVFSEVIGRDVRPDDTFVGVGGDSMSYVEMSIRLEQLLGHLPQAWPSTPVAELARASRAVRRRGRSVESNVVLRAAAIVAIVGSHAGLFTLLGGAHVLIAVVGFNFARFFLTPVDRTERARRLASSLARFVALCVVWLSLVVAFADDVGWRNVLLINGLIGPEQWTDASWHYWFVEAVAAILLAMLVLTSVPAFDRAERRWQFAAPVVLCLLALITRYEWVTLRGGDVIHRAHIVFWLFALGWAAAKARTPRQRLLLSVIAVASLPGFFEQDHRVLVVVLGCLMLIWVPVVRLPRAIASVVGVLAASSLATYLVHWQIYPALEDAGHSLAATLVSLLVGVLVWVAGGRLVAMVNNRRRPYLRRYVGDVSRRRSAVAPRGDDQPAHLAA